MTELWENATVAQAILVIAACWVIFTSVEALVSMVQRLRGKEPAWQHCEHCDTAGELDEHLSKLVALSEDQLSELADSRKAVEAIAVWCGGTAESDELAVR